MLYDPSTHPGDSVNLRVVIQQKLRAREVTSCSRIVQRRVSSAGGPQPSVCVSLLESAYASDESACARHLIS